MKSEYIAGFSPCRSEQKSSCREQKGHSEVERELQLCVDEQDVLVRSGLRPVSVLEGLGEAGAGEVVRPQKMESWFGWCNLASGSSGTLG